LPPKYKRNFGQIAAAKVCKALQAYGLTVHNVVASREPKLMSREALALEIARCAKAPIPSVPARAGE
jgi:hypothetical protein